MLYLICRANSLSQFMERGFSRATTNLMSMVVPSGGILVQHTGPASVLSNRLPLPWIAVIEPGAVGELAWIFIETESGIESAEIDSGGRFYMPLNSDVTIVVQYLKKILRLKARIRDIHRQMAQSS